MTARDLQRIYYIRREIDLYAAKLRTLRNRSLVGGGKMDGMPRSGAEDDAVSAAAIKAADLEATIEKLRDQLIDTETETMAFLSGIDDSLIRQTVYLRFVCCLPWKQVARKVGGGNTADSCRKMVRRFIQQDVRFVRSGDGKI